MIWIISIKTLCCLTRLEKNNGYKWLTELWWKLTSLFNHGVIYELEHSFLHGDRCVQSSSVRKQKPWIFSVRVVEHCHLGRSREKKERSEQGKVGGEEGSRERTKRKTFKKKKNCFAVKKIRMNSAVEMDKWKAFQTLGNHIIVLCGEASVFSARMRRTGWILIHTHRQPKGHPGSRVSQKTSRSTRPTALICL